MYSYNTIYKFIIILYRFCLWFNWFRIFHEICQDVINPGKCINQSACVEYYALFLPCDLLEMMLHSKSRDIFVLNPSECKEQVTTLGSRCNKMHFYFFKHLFQINPVSQKKSSRMRFD